MDRKAQLVNDIQDLLNGYDNKNSTTINQAMLDFMDEETLLSIIDTLLTQKESAKETDHQWLETFKKYKDC